MRLRFTSLMLLTALLASACATATFVPAQTTTDTAGTGAGADGDAPAELAQRAPAPDTPEGRYCAALQAMADATPTESGFSEDGFPEYADALERAADAAPLEHREALRLAAQLNRAPQEATFDQLNELADSTEPIFEFGTERCGVTFPDFGGEDSSTSIEFESSGPSISISSDGENAERFVPSGPGSEPQRAEPTGDPNAIAAAVNAAVPAGVDLSFEWQSAVKENDEGFSSQVLVPVGWDADIDNFGLTYSNSAFGFRTELEVGSGCQGICQAQDWSAVMDDPALSIFGVSSNDEVLLVQELSLIHI